MISPSCAAPPILVAHLFGEAVSENGAKRSLAAMFGLEQQQELAGYELMITIMRLARRRKIQ